MRKIVMALLLAFLTASCASSRCGCPTWGNAPAEQDDKAVMLTDLSDQGSVFVRQ